MPYFLRTDGVNDVVTTTALNGGSYVAEKFSFKVKASFPVPAPNGFRQSFTVGTSSIGFGVGLRPDGQFRVIIGNSAISVGAGVTGQIYEFEFSRPISQADTGSFQDVIFYVDGVETARVSQPDRTLTEFLTLGFDDRGTYSELDVYEVSWDDLSDSANNHSYSKQTLNGANDTVFPDTVGSNDGTLVNFPTDNSQWVFFNDGGGAVTADAAFTVNAPSIAINAGATLPQPIADINYSVSIPAVAASVAASLPQPTSDVNFTVSAPSVLANATATMPGYNASVSFAVNAPSVSANADATLPNPLASISYTVSAPSVSADVTAALPQPVSDVVFTVNTPSINATASATQTGWNADVSFAVNAPSVSISASTTLPQPSAAVSFAVSPPQVSVVAIVGGIAIIVDDETNINQRVLSNNINAPILSNNING